MIVITGAVVCGLVGIAFAAQDRYSLRIPDGLAFADFRGYETWLDVASSDTTGSIKAILANSVMIKAYRQGVPGNGNNFPEGSKIVKVEWLKQKSTTSPYFVEVPGMLKTRSFIEKDSKRFAATHGWAFAQWVYDPVTQTLNPSPPLSLSGHECGYACHTKVAGQDYIFTAYPAR
jgi:hypothetical protein